MRISDWSSDVCSSDLLKIPPLLIGKRVAGSCQFDLTLQSGLSRFFEDRETPTIGINGAYLGPTLEMAAGETVRINVTNRLTEPATLHWHGFHLPASADGGPHQPIEPRSEEHTSELQSLMRISYAVFCLQKKKPTNKRTDSKQHTKKT